MADPAYKIEDYSLSSIELDIEKVISGTHTEEIVIGLCGPIGTDITFVADRIEDILEKNYGYSCEKIFLSKFIKEQFPDIDYERMNKKGYYEDLIDKGNELRKKYSSNSILAELAINRITVTREAKKEEEKEDTYKSRRHCFIIDSIKHTEELELFRLVYREIFYFFSVFTPLESRVKNLNNKQIKTQDAYYLIDRDYNEGIKFGQKVSKIFVEADFFLRLDKSTNTTVEAKVKRYLHLIFNSDIITPTIHENAMYLAASAAGNSACLSRQVGAAITNEIGEILSIGWNDVPKYGGGLYQYNIGDPTNTDDHRCMHLDGGKCFNDEEKKIIVDELAREIINSKIVQIEQESDLKDLIAKSKIGQLIEFSRSIHAEMLAIISGSQNTGEKMRNGKLYCTTYPCHSCARHIVAAGIKEVYYIEPYPKSLATKLHYDSLTEDETKPSHVRILIYEGVSPKRYLEFFKMLPDSRKINGKRIKIFSTDSPKPKKTLTLQAIPILEKKITEKLVAVNLISRNEE